LSENDEDGDPLDLCRMKCGEDFINEGYGTSRLDSIWKSSYKIYFIESDVGDDEEDWL
jgi:hypothetical protein